MYKPLVILPYDVQVVINNNIIFIIIISSNSSISKEHQQYSWITCHGLVVGCNCLYTCYSLVFKLQPWNRGIGISFLPNEYFNEYWKLKKVLNWFSRELIILLFKCECMVAKQYRRNHRQKKVLLIGLDLISLLFIKNKSDRPRPLQCTIFQVDKTYVPCL